MWVCCLLPGYLKSKLLCFAMLSIDRSCSLWYFWCCWFALLLQKVLPSHQETELLNLIDFPWPCSWCCHVGTFALSYASRVLVSAWQLSSSLCFIIFPLFTPPSLRRGGRSENHYAESLCFTVSLPLLTAPQTMGFVFLFVLEVHKQISPFTKGLSADTTVSMATQQPAQSIHRHWENQKYQVMTRSRCRQ